MSLSTFSFPTTILFGAGSIGRLPGEAAAKGMKRPLLVTDRPLLNTSAYRTVSALIPGAVTFSAVDPNPTEKNVTEGTAFYHASGCDGVIGLGGGSALDAAKAIRLKATHTLPLAEYDDLVDGWAKITADLPPFIAIATTSGTGSEVGRSTVITIEATNRKTVIFSPHLIANPVINDPELTAGMPPAVTAGTGMDALTHNLEAYIAKGYHPLADAIALSGIKLCSENLPLVMANPGDIEARANMMMGSMMGAIAFQKGLGATHSLAHPLSSEFGMHHGTANAVLLPAVLEFNQDAAAARLTEVARYLAIGGVAERVRELNRICGIAPRLRDYAIPGDALEMLASKAIQDGCHLSNPRACTEADLLGLYQAAW